MALTTKFHREAIKAKGKRLDYGEYPEGEAEIKSASSSTRNESTWLMLVIMLSGVLQELRGDIRDFGNTDVTEVLKEDNTFDVVSWKYKCTGGRPEFIPVS